MELGHTLQCDCEDDSEAAQVHARGLEHLCVAGLGTLENGPVGRQQGQCHHLAVGEEPRFSIPRLPVKPSLPCLPLQVRPSVSDSQMYLAMSPTIYLALGAFPARSPIPARGSLSLGGG